MAAVCVSCRGAADCLGPLPHSNVFAGRTLSKTLSGGYLYRCKSCALGFRYPRLAKDALDALYASGSETAWTWTPTERTDWTWAAQAIEAHAREHASVLDIGCFDGTFLASLPGERERAGIEIIPQAADRARQKGVRILGSDFDCLEHLSDRFDVVTSFDVIEHVENPLAFLTLLCGVLRPGGMLIVSTGDLDAWSWRLMKNRYWYCAIPEHISFLSERWFSAAAATLNVEIVQSCRFAHSTEPLHRKARETVSNLAFLMSPRLIGAMRRRGIGSLSAQLDPAVVDEYPPGWASATDHILVAIKKPA